MGIIIDLRRAGELRPWHIKKLVQGHMIERGDQRFKFAQPQSRVCPDRVAQLVWTLSGHAGLVLGQGTHKKQPKEV